MRWCRDTYSHDIVQPREIVLDLRVPKVSRVCIFRNLCTKPLLCMLFANLVVSVLMYWLPVPYNSIYARDNRAMTISMLILLTDNVDILVNKRFETVVI